LLRLRRSLWSKPTKRPKLDETLERKQALELEEGVLTSVKALLAKEHKRKLTKDAKIANLVGKLSKEIPNKVIQESLKTLFV